MQCPNGGCVGARQSAAAAAALGIWEVDDTGEFQEELIDLRDVSSIGAGFTVDDLRSLLLTDADVEDGVDGDATCFPIIALQLIEVCSMRRDESLTGLEGARVALGEVMQATLCDDSAEDGPDVLAELQNQELRLRAAHYSVEQWHKRFRHYDALVDRARQKLRLYYTDSLFQRQEAAARAHECAVTSRSFDKLVAMDVTVRRKRVLLPRAKPSTSPSKSATRSQHMMEGSLSLNSPLGSAGSDDDTAPAPAPGDAAQRSRDVIVVAPEHTDGKPPVEQLPDPLSPQVTAPTDTPTALQPVRRVSQDGMPTGDTSASTSGDFAAAENGAYLDEDYLEDQMVTRIILFQRLWRKYLARKQARAVAGARVELVKNKRRRVLRAWHSTAVASAHSAWSLKRECFRTMLGYANIRNLRRIFACDKLLQCRHRGTLRTVLVMWCRYVLYVAAPRDKKTGFRERTFDTPFALWDDWVQEEAEATLIRDKMANVSFGSMKLLCFNGWRQYTLRRAEKRRKTAMAHAHHSYSLMSTLFSSWKYLVLHKAQLEATTIATMGYFLGRWKSYVNTLKAREHHMECITRVRTLRFFSVWRRRADRQNVLRTAGMFRLFHRSVLGHLVVGALTNNSVVLTTVLAWQQWRRYVNRRGFFIHYVAKFSEERCEQLQRIALRIWFCEIFRADKRKQAKIRTYLNGPTALFTRASAAELKLKFLEAYNNYTSFRATRQLYGLHTLLDKAKKEVAGCRGTQRKDKQEARPGILALYSGCEKKVMTVLQKELPEPCYQTHRGDATHRAKNWRRWNAETARTGDGLLFLALMKLLLWHSRGELPPFNIGAARGDDLAGMSEGIPGLGDALGPASGGGVRFDGAPGGGGAAGTKADPHIITDPLVTPLSAMEAAKKKASRKESRRADADDEAAAGEDASPEKDRRDARHRNLHKAKALLASLGTPFYDPKHSVVHVSACVAFFEDYRKVARVLVQRKLYRGSIVLQRFLAQRAAMRIHARNPRFTVSGLGPVERPFLLNVISHNIPDRASLTAGGSGGGGGGGGGVRDQPLARPSAAPPSPKHKRKAKSTAKATDFKVSIPPPSEGSAVVAALRSQTRRVPVLQYLLRMYLSKAAKSYEGGRVMVESRALRCKIAKVCHMVHAQLQLLPLGGPKAPAAQALTTGLSLQPISSELRHKRIVALHHQRFKTAFFTPEDVQDRFLKLSKEWRLPGGKSYVPYLFEPTPVKFSVMNLVGFNPLLMTLSGEDAKAARPARRRTANSDTGSDASGTAAGDSPRSPRAEAEASAAAAQAAALSSSGGCLPPTGALPAAAPAEAAQMAALASSIDVDAAMDKLLAEEARELQQRAERLGRAAEEAVRAEQAKTAARERDIARLEGQQATDDAQAQRALELAHLREMERQEREREKEVVQRRERMAELQAGFQAREKQLAEDAADPALASPTAASPSRLAAGGGGGVLKQAEVRYGLLGVPAAEAPAGRSPRASSASAAAKGKRGKRSPRSPSAVSAATSSPTAASPGAKGKRGARGGARKGRRKGAGGTGASGEEESGGAACIPDVYSPDDVEELDRLRQRNQDLMEEEDAAAAAALAATLSDETASGEPLEQAGQEEKADETVAMAAAAVTAEVEKVVAASSSPKAAKEGGKSAEAEGGKASEAGPFAAAASSPKGVPDAAGMRSVGSQSDLWPEATAAQGSAGTASPQEDEAAEGQPPVLEDDARRRVSSISKEPLWGMEKILNMMESKSLLGSMCLSEGTASLLAPAGTEDEKTELTEEQLQKRAILLQETNERIAQYKRLVSQGERSGALHNISSFGADVGAASQYDDADRCELEHILAKDGFGVTSDPFTQQSSASSVVGGRTHAQRAAARSGAGRMTQSATEILLHLTAKYSRLLQARTRYQLKELERVVYPVHKDIAAARKQRERMARLEQILSDATGVHAPSPGVNDVPAQAKVSPIPPEMITPPQGWHYMNASLAKSAVGGKKVVLHNISALSPDPLQPLPPPSEVVTTLLDRTALRRADKQRDSLTSHLSAAQEKSTYVRRPVVRKPIVLVTTQQCTDGVQQIQYVDVQPPAQQSSAETFKRAREAQQQHGPSPRRRAAPTSPRRQARAKNAAASSPAALAGRGTPPLDARHSVSDAEVAAFQDPITHETPLAAAQKRRTPQGATPTAPALTVDHYTDSGTVEPGAVENSGDGDGDGDDGGDAPTAALPSSATGEAEATAPQSEGPQDATPEPSAAAEPEAAASSPPPRHPSHGGDSGSGSGSGGGAAMKQRRSRGSARSGSRASTASKDETKVSDDEASLSAFHETSSSDDSRGGTGPPDPHGGSAKKLKKKSSVHQSTESFKQKRYSDSSGGSVQQSGNGRSLSRSTQQAFLGVKQGDRKRLPVVPSSDGGHSMIVMTPPPPARSSLDSASESLLFAASGSGTEVSAAERRRASESAARQLEALALLKKEKAELRKTVAEDEQLWAMWVFDLRGQLECASADVQGEAADAAALKCNLLHRQLQRVPQTSPLFATITGRRTELHRLLSQHQLAQRILAEPPAGSRTPTNTLPATSPAFNHPSARIRTLTPKSSPPPPPALASPLRPRPATAAQPWQKDARSPTPSLAVRAGPTLSRAGTAKAVPKATAVVAAATATPGDEVCDGADTLLPAVSDSGPAGFEARRGERQRQRPMASPAGRHAAIKAKAVPKRAYVYGRARCADKMPTLGFAECYLRVKKAAADGLLPNVAAEKVGAPAVDVVSLISSAFRSGQARYALAVFRECRHTHQHLWWASHSVDPLSESLWLWFCGERARRPPLVCPAAGVMRTRSEADAEEEEEEEEEEDDEAMMM